METWALEEVQGEPGIYYIRNLAHDNFLSARNTADAKEPQYKEVTTVRWIGSYEKWVLEYKTGLRYAIKSKKWGTYLRGNAGEPDTVQWFLGNVAHLRSLRLIGGPKLEEKKSWNHAN